MFRLIAPVAVALLVLMTVSGHAAIGTDTAARCGPACAAVHRAGDAAPPAAPWVRVARNAKCMGGFSGCLAHKISLGTGSEKASAICRRLCAGRGGKGARKKGLQRKGARRKGMQRAGAARAAGGKKCPSGYTGCLAHKVRLGTPRARAAKICHRVCRK